MLKSLVGFIRDLNKIDSSLIEDQTIEEIAEKLGSGLNDFEVENYRFIQASGIDSILKDGLLGDPYLLGCFNASFLADIEGFPLDFDDIEALQKTECFSVIGKIAARFISEIVREYVRGDGYGHHFGSYDGNEHEISVSGKDWFVFRVN